MRDLALGGRWLVALAALVLLALGGAPAAQAQAQARDLRERSFTHERSDLPANPDIRFGRLNNGMGYALVRNTQPAGTAAVRLRFNVGSLAEKPDELGIAHFLEHMVFNGSQNVPEGEMVRLLQRFGLAFGPDTNAYTSFGETVYMLDLPNTDQETMTTALTIMRETADRLTLSEAAINRERGVILSEERARDSVELRLARRQLSALMPGQLLPERFPIGTIEAINRVNRDQFLAFYQRAYRPEKATLVIAGDVDVAALERQIQTLFADWQQPGAGAPPPALGRVGRRSLQAAHFVEAGGPAFASITWVRPPELRADSVAERRRRLIRDLGYAVLNRRFSTMARRDDAPFLGASGDTDVYERSATFASVSASVRPGRWAEGLAAIDQEIRRLVRFGVTQAELDREITELRAALQDAVAGAGTRDSRSRAMEIVGGLNADRVVTSPENNLSRFEAAVAGLRAQTVSRAIAQELRGQGPVLFVADQTAIEGGDAAILEVYRTSQRQPVSAPVAEAAVEFPYASFGTPGQIVSQSAAAFDTEVLRFANGVQVTLKRTPYEAGRINLTIRTPGGTAALPAGKPGLALLAPAVLGEAGLGQLTTEQIEQVAAGRVVGLSLSIDDDSLRVVGQTRPEDLLLQLQLMAAAVTDPGWRGQGLQRMQAAAESFIAQYDTAPDRVLQRDSELLLRSGDDRWAFPSLAQVRSLTMQDYQTVFGPLLTRGPLEVSIVGDFDRAAVVTALSQTLGAIPPRPAQALTTRTSVRFPTVTAGATPVRLTHSGRADQALAFIVWPSVDFSDPRKARSVRLMRAVFENRLTDEFRERQGATYSPFTGEEFSEAFPGYGYISAGVEVTPDKLDSFFATIAEIEADMRAGNITEDELARARRPIIERLETNETRNPYWVANLADAQTNPRRFDLMRTRITDLAALTRADIATAARETFVDGRAIRIVVVPRTP